VRHPRRYSCAHRSRLEMSRQPGSAGVPLTRRDLRFRSLRFVQWNSVRFLLVCAVGFFWWVGGELVHELVKNSIEDEAARSSPPDSYPKPKLFVVNKNKDAQLRLPPDLDGTAVVYPIEVDRLVGPDGSFCTDLSLSDLAGLLNVDPQTIARKGSNDEVDPDAVLFTAVTGRLSEQAKALARRKREIQIQDGLPPSAVVEDWVQTKLSFSLKALKHPSADQKLVLDSIRHSALGLPRQPGAKTNAAPLMTIADGEQPTDFNFTGGSLPLEPIPHPRDVPTDADQYAGEENLSPDDHPPGVNALLTSDVRPARLAQFLTH
jgi:hypothetical protein